MKKFILAILIMGMFSCTNAKNVAENKSQQRTMASLQDLGVSDDDANGLAGEIENYQALAGAETISLTEKINQFNETLKSFNATAYSKSFTTAQKIKIMTNDLANAKITLNNFTGGRGFRYNYFAPKIEKVNSFLKNNDPQGAATAANSEAAIVIPVAKALGR